MAAANTVKLQANSASISMAKHSAFEGFFKGLAKSFVLVSAGMQYQTGNYSEEMAYLSRSVLQD